MENQKVCKNCRKMADADDMKYTDDCHGNKFRLVCGDCYPMVMVPCDECKRLVDRTDMSFTTDCHGITFRLVCNRCYPKVMAKGFDGEYYTEADECIDYDY